MSVSLQMIFGALLLGAGEGVALLVRGLGRRSKHSGSGPRTGAGWPVAQE